MIHVSNGSTLGALLAIPAAFLGAIALVGIIAAIGADHPLRSVSVGVAALAVLVLSNVFIFTWS